MVKVLRRRGRSGGAHIEGREGAACPDALCPDNDDDGDHHDGHHVAEVPVPSWIPISARRWVHALPTLFLQAAFRYRFSIPWGFNGASRKLKYLKFGPGVEGWFGFVVRVRSLGGVFGEVGSLKNRLRVCERDFRFNFWVIWLFLEEFFLKLKGQFEGSMLLDIIILKFRETFSLWKFE